MKVLLDQFFTNAKLFLQRHDSRCFVQCVSIEIMCLVDTQFMQIARRFRLAMIGGQHDQGIIQSNFLIHIGEQFRQRTVKARDVVFALQAGCTKHVADIIGG